MSVRELTRTSSWHSPFSPTITQVSFPSMHYQIHPGCLSRGQVLLLPVRTCYRPGARTLPGWNDDTCGASLQPTNITPKRKSLLFSLPFSAFLSLRIKVSRRQEAKAYPSGRKPPAPVPTEGSCPGRLRPRGGSGPGAHTSRPGGGEEGDGSRRSSLAAQRGPGKVKITAFPSEVGNLKKKIK